MARRVVQRRSTLEEPLPPITTDGDPEPTAFGKEDDAGIVVRTLLLLRFARRWRGAARQSARQARLDDISADSDVVPVPGEMPVILEVFCGLHGGLAAAVLLQDSAPAGERWARQLGWSAALEGPAVAALCCEFTATDDGAYFRNFAPEAFGHTPP